MRSEIALFLSRMSFLIPLFRSGGLVQKLHVEAFVLFLFHLLCFPSMAARLGEYPRH